MSEHLQFYISELSVNEIMRKLNSCSWI